MAKKSRKKINRLNADEARAELKFYSENDQMSSIRAMHVRRRLQQLGQTISDDKEKLAVSLEPKLTIERAIAFLNDVKTISQRAFVAWARERGASRDGARNMYKEAKVAIFTA